MTCTTIFQLLDHLFNTARSMVYALATLALLPGCDSPSETATPIQPVELRARGGCPPDPETTSVLSHEEQFAMLRL